MSADADAAPIDIAAWLARPEWHDRAACRGVNPELFYPERGHDTSYVKTICRRCPVRAECLDYAMINGEKFGTWGGLSERERRALRRKIVVRDGRSRLADPECGTPQGFHAHRNDGEAPCTPCRDAYAAQQKALLAS